MRQPPHPARVFNFTNMCNYVKKPCKNCPFRSDIKPFLHPKRAAELAYSASNPYSDFPCHKTFDYDGDEDDFGRKTGDFSQQKTCAGFLTLRAQAGEDVPDGFEPSWHICYTDEYDMIETHDNAWGGR